MITSKDLVVSKELLQSVKMSPQELAIEIAVYLYEKKRLTLGQAKRFAGLDQISFQKELAKRNVFIHYEAEDVMKDAENLGIKF
jgi:predicted HTH domain antitoxin